MAQPGSKMFRRIRCIKSSLDKAEQSFLDNKDIRGELDLMLAEAELKNLRRKKDLPWRWNRHILAGCIALLLVLAGVSGYYLARDHYKAKAMAAEQPKIVQVQPKAQAQAAKEKTAAPQAKQQAVIVENNIKQDVPAKTAEPAPGRVTISKADMHKLVQSARVELSNSN